MRTIHQTYQINAPISKVWKALVDSEYIEKWGGGPSKMDDKIGTHFELWGNEIHGTNLEVEDERKLVQEWFSTDSPHGSRVTFMLTKEADDKTKVELLHENIPADKYDDLEKGWDDYYLGAIKEFLEY